MADNFYESQWIARILAQLDLAFGPSEREPSVRADLELADNKLRFRASFANLGMVENLQQRLALATIEECTLWLLYLLQRNPVVAACAAGYGLQKVTLDWISRVVDHGDSATLQQMLDPSAKLAQLGMVECHHGEFRASERTLNLLRGDESLECAHGFLFSPRLTDTVIATDASNREIWQDATFALVVGNKGSGRFSSWINLAAAHRRTMLVVDASTFDINQLVGQRELRATARETCVHAAIPVVRNFEAWQSAAAMTAFEQHFLQWVPGPVWATSTTMELPQNRTVIVRIR
jgi:hypothetical protein